MWSGISDDWDSSKGEEAFTNWTSCGIQAREDTADRQVPFFCTHGSVARYVVLTRTKSCGFLYIDQIKIYGDFCELALLFDEMVFDVH
jgi:hypothetical protein